MAVDRNLRARSFAYFRAYNAKHRTRGQHIGPLTRACRDVLRALLWLTDRRKAVSYLAIAAEAGCTPKTVWKALKRLRASGLLTWVNRYLWSDKHGKVVRTLNEYRWLEPQMPDQPSKLPKFGVTLPSQDLKGASQVMGSVKHVSQGLEAALGRLMALKPGG